MLLNPKQLSDRQELAPQLQQVHQVHPVRQQQLPLDARRRSLRADRPCDVCRKRKLKCVKEAKQDKCVLCLFHSRECTYRDEPQRRKSRRTSRSSVKEVQPSTVSTSASASSLLDSTLGLHRSLHYRHVGPGSLHECVLNLPDGSTTSSFSSSFWKVDASTAFVAGADPDDPGQDADDLAYIEDAVRPHGPALLDRYWQTVHPSYPVLHPDGSPGRRHVLAPPLLAAVYLLAMDGWEHDARLAGHARPDTACLVQMATRALVSAAVHRPRLSTVQAALLLLQRSGGDSWVLTSQAVAVAEELGLHLDCTTWAIPDWERRLRRRLAWAVFMQDTWSALLHGRPSHTNGWALLPLSPDDFDKQDTPDDRGLLFIHLARLTAIVVDGFEHLYGSSVSAISSLSTPSSLLSLSTPSSLSSLSTPSTLSPVSSSSSTSSLSSLAGLSTPLSPPSPLDQAKPVVLCLKAWASALPAQLRMDDADTCRLSTGGFLNLAYFAAEIAVCRFIVCTLPDDAPPALRQLCRNAARIRLEHAMRFVHGLRPAHLQTFWWCTSARCLAGIAAYAVLLWSTSTADDEADLYRQKVDEFRASLKARAPGVPFVAAALHQIDECLQNVKMERRGGPPSKVGQTIYVRTEPRRPTAVRE